MLQIFEKELRHLEKSAGSSHSTKHQLVEWETFILTFPVGLPPQMFYFH